MPSLDEEAETNLLKTLLRWLLIFIIATALFKMMIEWLYKYRTILIVIGVIVLTIFLIVRIKRWRKTNRNDY